VYSRHLIFFLFDKNNLIALIYRVGGGFRTSCCHAPKSSLGTRSRYVFVFTRRMRAPSDVRASAELKVSFRAASRWVRNPLQRATRLQLC